MKIVSIHSNKGGVGKTSIAIAIATFLASKAKKVLLLDADFTGGCISDTLGNPVTDKPKKKFYLDALIQYTPEEMLNFLSKKILPEMFHLYKCLTYEVKYVPSRSEISLIKRLIPFLVQESNYHYFSERLAMLIDKLCEYNEFDYVIIDCPPGLHGFSDVVLNISDYYETETINCLVTTMDKMDACTAFKNWDKILLNIQEKRSTQSHILVNKAKMERGRFDSAFIASELEKIGIQINNYVSAQNLYALRFDSDFNIDTLVSTIENSLLIEKKPSIVTCHGAGKMGQVWAG